MGVLISYPSLRVVYMEGKKMYTHSNSNFRFYILGIDYSSFSETVMFLTSGLLSVNLPFLEIRKRFSSNLLFFVYLFMLFCSITAVFNTVVSVI